MVLNLKQSGSSLLDRLDLGSCPPQMPVGEGPGSPQDPGNKRGLSRNSRDGVLGELQGGSENPNRPGGVKGRTALTHPNVSNRVYPEKKRRNSNDLRGAG